MSDRKNIWLTINHDLSCILIRNHKTFFICNFTGSLEEDPNIKRFNVFNIDRENIYHGVMSSLVNMTTDSLVEIVTYDKTYLTGLSLAPIFKYNELLGISSDDIDYLIKEPDDTLNNQGLW